MFIKPSHEVTLAPRVQAPVARLLLALLAIPEVLSLTVPSCEVKGKSRFVAPQIHPASGRVLTCVRC